MRAGLGAEMNDGTYLLSPCGVVAFYYISTNCKKQWICVLRCACVACPINQLPNSCICSGYIWSHPKLSTLCTRESNFSSSASCGSPLLHASVLFAAPGGNMSKTGAPLCMQKRNHAHKKDVRRPPRVPKYRTSVNLDSASRLPTNHITSFMCRRSL